MCYVFSKEDENENSFIEILHYFWREARLFQFNDWSIV